MTLRYTILSGKKKKKKKKANNSLARKLSYSIMGNQLSSQLSYVTHSDS